MKYEKKDYTELLHRCLEKAYKSFPIPDEYKKTDEEWLVLFDIMEAHFIAHNIMDRFESEMEDLAWNIALFERGYPKDNAYDTFKSVLHEWTSFCERQQFYSIECQAMREELEERLNKLKAKAK
jgi:hypothetical protein